MRGSAPILLAVVAALLLAIIGLYSLPSPHSSPEQSCADSPLRPACRALVRIGAAPELPRDLGPVDAAPPPLDATVPPLLACQAALASGWPVVALRRCEEAAAADGPDRAAALLTAGAATLRMGWPARAIYFGQRVLDGSPLPSEEGAAWLLIGDGHRAQKNCRDARTAYLRALDLAPDLEEARRGLESCGAVPPPRPDLTGDLDEEQAHALV